MQVGLSDRYSTVITDETRLRQILINLLGNAIKFTESGEVIFGYEVQGDKLKFFVKDTGVGIDKDYQDLVFERFQQGSKHTEKLYGGTGLGLSIVKACAELLGGEVWVESELGEGSRFYFTISYEPEQPVVETPDRKKGGKLPGFHGETVLVAEDDAMSYGLLERILTNENLKVLHAEDGAEAVKLAREHDEIRMVLMDMCMPELSGDRACGIIKNERPNLSIIAQTAYAFESDRTAFLDAGCGDFISKPIEKDLLLKKLHKYLDR